MSNIEKIRQEIERRKKICEGLFERESDTYYQGKAVAYGELLPFIDSLPEENLSEDLEEAAKNIYKVPFGTRAEDFIVGAEWQKEQDKDWLNEELIKAHLNGVMTGDRIARESLPMPEDTVIFQKGVAEGRRLEREDNNKALAEMYGYEGGTESPLVKITFTIPEEHFNRLIPIKQGDVFGIENLTNKEGRK